MLRTVALLLLLLAGSAAARETEEPTGPAPEKNFSHIHADTEWVVKAFKAAAEAAASGDWSSAARTLQAVIDTRTSRESPGDAAPYVRAVHGTTVYEGAWIVARHRLAAWGEPALNRYAQEFGALARERLATAVAQRDATLLAEVATRFLGLPEGRRAALLLIDLALEHADRDRALHWIQALEDLEAVTAESAEALAPWRKARIERQALVLARDAEALPAVRRRLDASDPKARLAKDIDPLLDDGRDPRATAGLLRRPPAPEVWRTTGGNAARSALVASLGTRFRLAWARGPGEDGDLVDTVDPEADRHDRPSAWLPPRAVATAEHLFVSDGEFLHVYVLESGRRAVPRVAGRYPGALHQGIGYDTPEDRRPRFGLLEGHALTVHPVDDFVALVGDDTRRFPGPGQLVLAAVPDGNPWPVDRVRAGFLGGRNDHIQAFHWNGLQLRPLWRAGGLRDDRSRGGLPGDTRLYGAPLVYRGRVWVGGVRPAKATPDRWEAWLYALDPQSGRVLSRTHLGTGTPVRTARVDEVIPSSPAAANGRVVVCTSLGILAAVDASDGRVHWIYRYDRAVETERGRRRNRDTRDVGQRAASFMNEPPILALDRCFVAPTDSDKVLIVLDRPRSDNRSMDSESTLDRAGVVSRFLAEQVAGVVPGWGERPSYLVAAGKGDSGTPPGPLVAAKNVVTKDFWTEHSPTGFGPYPYGRALVTEAEVFVPTRHGIAIFELYDEDGDGTHYRGVLNRSDMPDADASPEAPYGNLIPVPGAGLVAVSATTIAFWKRH